MRQHFIKKGLVDDYSQNFKQKHFDGFHMEGWLKRACRALNIPFIDNCCVDPDVTFRPVRFNPDTEELESYNGTLWSAVGNSANLNTALSGKANMVSAPASATSNGTAGQIAYDAGFFYVCVATNTWKRVAISTW